VKLEDQVCSLELAKRLKELGVKQESHFYHIKERAEWRLWPYTSPGFSLEGIREHPREDWEVYSAFTVAELGDMLPKGFYQTFFVEDGVVVGRPDFKVLENTFTTEKETTEANARAQMLIYLLENKLVKP